MRLLILIVLIIAISTFKSELDKNKSKNKGYKSIFDEIKKNMEKQKKAITDAENPDKVHRNIVTTQTKVKEIKTTNTINDYYNETYKEDNSIIEDIFNNNFETKDHVDLKKDLKINPKRAFIYSEIFNRRY